MGIHDTMTDQDQSNARPRRWSRPPAPVTPEPRDAPAPDAQRRSPGRAGRRTAAASGRARWASRLGAVAVVAALTAAIVFALVGRSPDATVARLRAGGPSSTARSASTCPATSAAKIAEFLSNFPGFADQATLETKLDEVLDRLVSDATDGKQTFTANIKPWFGGELAFGVGPLPDPKTILSAPTDPGRIRARALALLSIKDEALARAWFDRSFKQAGATTTTETYDGAELTMFSDPTRRRQGRASRSSTARSPSPATSPRSRPRSTPRATAASPRPTRKAALDAPTAITSGSSTSALRRRRLVPAAGAVRRWAGRRRGASRRSDRDAREFIPAGRPSGSASRATRWSMEAAAPQVERRSADADRPSRESPSTSRLGDRAASSSPRRRRARSRTLELFKAEPSLKEVTEPIEQALGALGGAEAPSAGWATAGSS